jgi:UrcA family protein
MTTTSKWISSLAVATVVSLTASPSLADHLRAPTTTVKAWDLDLDKPADVHTLYERLRLAATDVCLDEVRNYRRNTRMRAPLGWQERCIGDAITSAVEQVGDSRLSAVHAEKRGTSELVVTRR